MTPRRAGAVLAALLLTAAVAAASLRSTDERPTSPRATTIGQDSADLLLAARIKGDPDAPVTVLEASDFQCPYCRVFWQEVLPVLEREYISTGKIRFVFLNLPLPSLHENAPAAHEFAMCAAAQDRFWPIHDLLYEHQSAWAELDDASPYFFRLAGLAGLDLTALQECFEAGAVRQLIQEEVQLNVRSGVRSTPSFVIEGGLLVGAQPIEVWRPILDSLIAARTTPDD
jgi:protein-disulfide isomerase